MGFAIATALPYLLRRPRAARGAGSPQWKSFVDAARATDFYRRSGIDRSAVLELDHFYRHHAAFRNPAGPVPPPSALEAPWEPLPRVTALKPWFRLDSAVGVVLSPSIEEVAQRAPEVLAGPVPLLLATAVSVLQRRLRLDSLTYGVIAFTGFSRLPLTPAARDLLWRAFGVPVFEQFRGFQGEILAHECEAHDGLHYAPAAAVWEERPGGTGELLVTSLANLRYPAHRLATGYRGTFDYRRCPCGSPLPRIRWGAAAAAAAATGSGSGPLRAVS